MKLGSDIPEEIVPEQIKAGILKGRFCCMQRTELFFERLRIVQPKKRNQENDER